MGIDEANKHATIGRLGSMEDNCDWIGFVVDFLIRTKSIQIFSSNHVPTCSNFKID